MALYLGSNKAASCPVIDITNTSYYIDTRQITEFYYFFYINRRLELLDKLDTRNGVYFSSMFYQCTNLTSVPQLDTRNGIQFGNMFYGCTNLTSVPQLDTRNAIVLNGMFSGCTNLTSVPQLDMRNCTQTQSMFANCYKLENVSLTTPAGNLSNNTFSSCGALTNLTIENGWDADIYLTYSPKLTQECLHAMIENLADLTGQDAKILKIGTTNINKLDAEHLAMLEDKNWNYS